jgi:hypothetical protein
MSSGAQRATPSLLPAHPVGVGFGKAAAAARAARSNSPERRSDALVGERHVEARRQRIVTLGRAAGEATRETGKKACCTQYEGNNTSDRACRPRVRS